MSEDDREKETLPMIVEEGVENAETKQINSLGFVVPFTPLKNASTPYKPSNTHGSAFKGTLENKENKIQAIVPISSAKKTKPVSCIFSTPKLNCKTGVKKTVNIPLKDVTLKYNKTLCVKGVNYVILKELGKGGSSVVYDCYEPTSGVSRAIKQVSVENRSSASGFINEVELLAKLQNCSNIIRMYD